MERQREGDRKPIIWALSISRLQRIFRDIAPAYADAADIDFISEGFEDALRVIRERRKTESVDVLVAAGSNGAFLRRHADAPVALVKVSGFDMLQALAKARRVSQRIGLVTHETITPELAQFKHLFNLGIELRAYSTADDAKDCVRELQAMGVEVIVGPGLVTDLAEAAGLTGVFLYSQDAVRQALDDAIEIARAGRIEVARRARLDTILHQLHEGVVTVDMEERIQSLNPAMSQLLGLPVEQAIGSPLGAIEPALSLRRTLQTGEAELEGIHLVRQKTIVANRMPIYEQGVQTGAVLTFQDSTAIQRVDRNLRSRQKPRHLAAKYKLDDLLGESAGIANVKRMAANYAKTDATVLLIGESGTGKELLAQGIHNASRRKAFPFVAVNCAAFPETLLESELFGYEEGAFTGSRRGGKSGLFEAAHTGSIFLDEIGDIPIALQTRLLRVLQEKEVLRLGATEPTPVDVRVIAATHRNLPERVATGQFRQDLYYRLNILRIDIPPLRERIDDVPPIAAQLLEKALRRNNAKRPVGGLLEMLLPLLREYPWPGNVRELENIIERVAVYYACLEHDEPFDAQRLSALSPELRARGFAAKDKTAPSLKSIARENQLAEIHRVLEECGGDRDQACRRLGIGRTTLWRRLSRQ